MSVDITASNIDQMSSPEKMHLIGILWDSMGERITPGDIPDWHRTLLDQRLADIDANPQAGRPWEDVLADLKKKRS